LCGYKNALCNKVDKRNTKNSLVAVKLFGKERTLTGRGKTEAVLYAGTDNQAAQHLSLKGSSTKMPVMLALMQLAITSSEQWLRLQLKWRPRLENQPADALTNEDFKDFDPEKRIVAEWTQLGFDLLEDLAKIKEEFEEELLIQKTAKKALELLPSSSSKKRRIEKSDW
jgi:hypothetical protein